MATVAQQEFFKNMNFLRNCGCPKNCQNHLPMCPGAPGTSGAGSIPHHHPGMNTVKDFFGQTIQGGNSEPYGFSRDPYLHPHMGPGILGAGPRPTGPGGPSIGNQNNNTLSNGGDPNFLPRAPLGSMCNTFRGPRPLIQNRGPIISNVVSPPPFLDTPADMFKYYEKTYPEQFISFLKLNCMPYNCKICSTVKLTVQNSMSHYRGKKHARFLKENFDEWSKNPQARKFIIPTPIVTAPQVVNLENENSSSNSAHTELPSWQIPYNGNRVRPAGFGSTSTESGSKPSGSGLFSRLCKPGSGLNKKYDLICTKCTQRGHERENCPQNLICGKCGNDGHLRKDCKIVQDSNDDEDIEVIVPPPKPAPLMVDLENEDLSSNPVPNDSDLDSRSFVFEFELKSEKNEEKLSAEDSKDDEEFQVIIPPPKPAPQIVDLENEDFSSKSTQKDSTHAPVIAKITDPETGEVIEFKSKFDITKYKLNQIKKSITKSYENGYPVKFRSLYTCSPRVCEICKTDFVIKGYSFERILAHYKSSRHSDEVKKVYDLWNFKNQIPSGENSKDKSREKSKEKTLKSILKNKSPSVEKSREKSKEKSREKSKEKSREKTSKRFKCDACHINFDNQFDLTIHKADSILCTIANSNVNKNFEKDSTEVRSIKENCRETKRAVKMTKLSDAFLDEDEYTY